MMMITSSQKLSCLLRHRTTSSAMANMTRPYSVTSTQAMPMKPGEKLPGMAIFKGQDPPVVLEQYPEWVSNLAKPEKSLAKLRRIPNDEASDKDILRFLKLKRRFAIRESNEAKSV